MIYSFDFISGWIGGVGIVIANNKAEAVQKVNAKLPTVAMAKQHTITEDDLKEITEDVTILEDGNY